MTQTAAHKEQTANTEPEVKVGSKVVVTFQEERPNETFIMVATVEEHNPKAGKHHEYSAIGKILFGKKIGDTVEMPEPEDNISYASIASIT